MKPSLVRKYEVYYFASIFVNKCQLRIYEYEISFVDYNFQETKWRNLMEIFDSYKKINEKCAVLEFWIQKSSHNVFVIYEWDLYRWLICDINCHQ